MKIKSLRQRVSGGGVRERLFLLVLLIIALALGVQVAGAWMDLQQDIAERKQDAVHVMAHAQGDFKTLLAGTRAMFADLVRLNEMRRPNNCAQLFNPLRLAFARLQPQATNISLSDAKGNIFCAVKPMLGERNIASQPVFKAAFQKLDQTLGVYGLDPLTGAPTLSIAYPVLSFDGQVQTVVLATFDTQWLEVWQNEVALPEGAALTLVGPDGAVLQRSVNGVLVPTQGTAQEAAWFAPLQNGQTVVEALDLDGIKRLHSLVPLEQDGQIAAYLHLGYPVEGIYAKTNHALEWKLGLLALTLLVGLALAGWGSEKLFLQPLRSLMSVIGQVEAGDLQARAAGEYGLSELTLFGKALNRMADAIQQRETARQQVQTELQDSEARFRAVLDNAAVGVAVMSLDRRILQINVGSPGTELEFAL